MRGKEADMMQKNASVKEEITPLRKGTIKKAIATNMADDSSFISLFGPAGTKMATAAAPSIKELHRNQRCTKTQSQKSPMSPHKHSVEYKIFKKNLSQTPSTDKRHNILSPMKS